MLTPIDTLWLIFCTCLLFLQQAGFLCLESGLTRKKNNINVAVKNFCDIGVAFVTFFAVTQLFDLDFVVFPSENLVGSSAVVDLQKEQMHGYAILTYQALLCCTTVSIISGAVAERVPFIGYLCIALLVAGVIYPTSANAIWGADSWLKSMGFYDFSGATAVHSVGGWVALAAVFVIGSRIGRFDTSCDISTRKTNTIQPSSLSSASLGAVLLCIGWLGFSSGHTGMFHDRIPLVILNTILAGSASLIFSIISPLSRGAVVEVPVAINGCLTGLVAITGCAYLTTPLEAIAVGASGGVLACFIHMWFEKLRIDDAVGSIEVHLAGGIWGTLITALFMDGPLLSNLAVQLIGVLMIGAWTFCLAFASLYLIKHFVTLRVSEADEALGLNISEHNARSDLVDLVDHIREHANTGDVSQRLSIEPFGEMAMVGLEYNNLLDKIEKKERDVKGSHEIVEAYSKHLAKTLTEIKQKNCELEKATKEAKNANSAKGVFLKNMTHEIRTPLNSIIGYSQRGIRKNYHDVATSSFEIINNAGKHLLEIINNIIDISSIESDEIGLFYKEMELEGCLESIYSVASAQVIEKGLTIHYSKPDALPLTVFGDQIRIKQVFLNLLNNAIKFTREGRIDIEMSFLPDGDHSGTLSFSISDTGIGIAEENLELIFASFKQVDELSTRHYGGNGLGLCIVKSLVEKMNGEIAVTSNLDKGSCFSGKLYFPPPEQCMPRFSSSKN
ncbi:MAG: hypothetical protein COA42_07995 [Alteromonadaceae bacterium]|nr:MAG: hypothetical protein COA42_07995 [Alteromonadaceae bacterium]